MARLIRDVYIGCFLIEFNIGEMAELAEGAPLLREYGVYSSIEGSNPSLSAILMPIDTNPQHRDNAPLHAEVMARNSFTTTRP